MINSYSTWPPSLSAMAFNLFGAEAQILRISFALAQRVCLKCEDWRRVAKTGEDWRRVAKNYQKLLEGPPKTGICLVFEDSC